MPKHNVDSYTHYYISVKESVLETDFLSYQISFETSTMEDGASQVVQW